jgi:hypothetical protein
MAKEKLTRTKLQFNWSLNTIGVEALLSVSEDSINIEVRRIWEVKSGGKRSYIDINNLSYEQVAEIHRDFLRKCLDKLPKWMGK